MNGLLDRLRLEPWCYTPSQIAVLTDYQIIHNYILPQANRDEDFERERKGLPRANDGSEVDERGPDWKPNKAFMVNTLMGLGMTKEQAIREYAAQDKLNAKTR